MLPDPVSRSSERRAMRDEKIDELCMEHVALKAILGEMHIENADLRARCARLRAALAGVCLSGPDDGSMDAEYDLVISQLKTLPEQDAPSPLRVTPRELIAAYLVLRETAGEGKT